MNLPTALPTTLPTTLPPFKSLHYAGALPGPRLIVTGAVHGNEVCGTQAIARLAAELDAGTLRIQHGALTLVPICNPLAYHLGQRQGQRNLNRALAPTATPREYEDQVANWLCPLLAQHDGLVDLHSFQSAGLPFVLLGPADNTGPLEPFALAAREEALVRCLGVGRAVDGWLSTYARGVQRRREQARGSAADTLDMNPRYGVGTTEFMRSQGGWALTLECGQHADPQAAQVGYQAIRNMLAHLGLTGEAAPPAVAQIEALSLHEVIDKAHADDAFARDWRSFDALLTGDLIGTRHDGTAVRAPHDGWIVFPNARAQARQEWFYLARASTRL